MIIIFEIGGTSLLLATVECELACLFDKRLTITELFDYPTIRTLAARLADEVGKSNWALESQERARRQQAAFNDLRKVARGA